MTKLKFREAWGFPEQVENIIVEIMKEHPGKWLHAPVGKSKIGRDLIPEGCKVVTFDIDDSVKPDIIGDLWTMSTNPQVLKEGPFDGIISDPVWLKIETCANCKDEKVETTKGLAYPKRRYLSYEARDLLKMGGWWIFNGLWDPTCHGMEIEPNTIFPSGVGIPFQSYNSYRNLSLLMVLKKTADRKEV